MLSNAYFLATFRFGTAENKPAKNLQNFASLNLSRLAIVILDLLTNAPLAAGAVTGEGGQESGARRRGRLVRARRGCEEEGEGLRFF